MPRRESWHAGRHKDLVSAQSLEAKKIFTQNITVWTQLKKPCVSSTMQMFHSAAQSPAAVSGFGVGAPWHVGKSGPDLGELSAGPGWGERESEGFS